MSVQTIYNQVYSLKKNELDELIAKLQKLSANCIYYENATLPYRVTELLDGTPDPKKIDHMVRFVASFAQHEFDAEDDKVQTIADYLIRYIDHLIDNIPADAETENGGNLRETLNAFCYWHTVAVEIIGDMVNSDKTIQEKIPDALSLEKYTW